MNLRGRTDLPLVHLAQSTSLVSVSQTQGPMEIVQLDTGAVVLEIPEGERAIRVAVPPGHYVVRALGAEQPRGREVVVEADQTTTIREDQLELIGRPGLGSRTFEPNPMTLSTVKSGVFELRLAAGVAHGQLDIGPSIGTDESVQISFGGSFGISDRWQWHALTGAFAYRGGERGGIEWIPWGGLTRWGLGFSSVDGFILNGQVGAGLDMRFWLGPNNSLVTTSGLRMELDWAEKGSRNGAQNLDSSVALGYTHTIGGVVTVGLGAQYVHRVWDQYDDQAPSSDARLRFGSVLELGLRPLPLIRIHLGDSFALDGYTTVEWDPQQGRLRDSYLAGFAVSF